MIGEPQRGGSQAFVADLATGLVSGGHDVDLYAPSGSRIPGVNVVDTGVDPQTLRGALFRAGGTTDRSARPAVEAAFDRVYAMLRNRIYDVVHNHAFDAPAVRLASEIPAPVVHTLHLPPQAVMVDALRDARRSDAPPTVAAVSAAQARAWEDLTDIDVILPSFVPTSRIPWSASAGEGVLFAGRFSPEKGAAEAIDIAQSAGMRIDVYGDAYDAEYTAECIAPRRSRARVSVHEAVPRPRLWELMSHALAVLCPARWEEPFGMVAAEAQACGTPVVAYRRGGLQEVIVDGVTGFLVPPDDVGAAADALHETATLSRRECRRHAEAHLDLERSLDMHQSLYRRVSRG
jgi:glycosyltransferase involved in cell wall biosynthesis